MNVVEVLQTAKSYVVNGWCQSQAYTGNDDHGTRELPAGVGLPTGWSCCAWGALYLASPDASLEYQATQLLAEQIAPGEWDDNVWTEKETAFDVVTRFNDDEHTTQEDILRVYDQAIAAASA